jgi:hypothetical protein
MEYYRNHFSPYMCGTLDVTFLMLWRNLSFGYFQIGISSVQSDSENNGSKDNLLVT